MPATLLELLAMELPDVCSMSYLVSAMPATRNREEPRKNNYNEAKNLRKSYKDCTCSVVCVQCIAAKFMHCKCNIGLHTNFCFNIYHKKIIFNISSDKKQEQNAYRNISAVYLE